MVSGGITIVSAVVALFGVTSAILGFIAEAKRLKPEDVNHVNEITGGCVYPANPSLGLGLSAGFLLLVAEIIASAAGGCCGCCRPGAIDYHPPKSKLFMGIIASILSWVAALVAIAFYLVGAASNAALRRGTGADGGCYNLRSGAFTRAAVLTLVAAGLGIVSFILLTRRPHRMASAGNGPKPDGHTPLGVAMQPQYPAA